MAALFGNNFRSFFTLTRSFGLAWLAILLALHWWNPVPIDLLRMQGFDLYQQLAPRHRTDASVVVVDIDEASLNVIGQWPWPRTVVASLIEQLFRKDAAAVGLDILFAEPDRLSPQQIAESNRGLGPGIAEALRALPNNDQVLAATLRRTRVVLGRTETVWNLPLLEAAAAGSGVFNLDPERDGIVRRVPAVIRVDQDLHPSLGVELLRVAAGADRIEVDADDAGIKRVYAAGAWIPTDGRGRIWMHFAPHDCGRYLSAQDVIAGRIEPASVAGKLVLVGTSAAGLIDAIATPIGESMPSVEVQAQVLESIMTRGYLTRPRYAPVVERLIIFAIGMLLIVLVPTRGALWTLGLYGVAAGGLAAAAGYLFSSLGVLIDAANPTLAVFSIYALLSFMNYHHEESAKKRALQAYRELEEMQESLIQAEKLASLGRLVAGVAHEVNTPIGITLTAATHLAEKTESLGHAFESGQLRKSDFKGFVELATETTQIMLTNLNRAADLIHSFKEVAVDQASEEWRRFDLGEYIQEVLMSLRPKLKQVAHEITVECPPDLEVGGYPGALAQVLTNLLMNSLIHAYDEGQAGKLRITVSQPSPDEIELRYVDDGKGIAKEHLAKVFDPFFTTRRGAGGSGLGLNVVFNLVSQTMGGRISVESEPGRGTLFVVQFPRMVAVPGPAEIVKGPEKARPGADRPI